MASFGYFSTSKSNAHPGRGNPPHCMGKTIKRQYCRKNNSALRPAAPPRPGHKGQNLPICMGKTIHKRLAIGSKEKMWYTYKGGKRLFSRRPWGVAHSAPAVEHILTKEVNRSMNFDMYLPFRLITGEDCIQKNAARFSEYGGRCLIVTGKHSAKASGALQDVQAALESAGVTWILYDEVEPNPSLLGSQKAGRMARDFSAEFVVGIGGGSPLDAAKAAAVFASNEMDAMDLFNLDWPNPALPLVLVGTTAGTGSEVGGAAVLTTPENRKKSISHTQTYPALAFGDAKYTYSLSPQFTVSTALDALSHALEGYFATNANLVSDLFAIQAVEILAKALPRLKGAQAAPDIAPELREELYYASVLAGFTLARCGTCYCHSMGYYLTENYGTPHGTACAVFLPDFIRRQTRLLPEKAARLYAKSGASADALCAVITLLTDFTYFQVSEEAADLWADRTINTNNATRTAPKGYAREEAAALIRSLFGAKS